MKEEITTGMIEKVMEALKSADYDGNTLKIEIGPVAPCSITQAFMPDIIDMALKELHLKSKTRKLDVFFGYTDKEIFQKQLDKDMKQKVLVRNYP